MYYISLHFFSLKKENNNLFYFSFSADRRASSKPVFPLVSEANMRNTCMEKVNWLVLLWVLSVISRFTYFSNKVRDGLTIGLITLS